MKKDVEPVLSHLLDGNDMSTWAPSTTETKLGRGPENHLRRVFDSDCDTEVTVVVYLLAKRLIDVFMTTKYFL